MWEGLAVVVVNFASSDLLAANLTSTMRRMPGARTFVVDNFSSAAEQDRVRDLADRHGWSVIMIPENLGFGAGVNRGAEAAFAVGAEEVLLLNPDATIEADAVMKLRERGRADAAIVAPLIRRSDGRMWSRGGVLRWADGATLSAHGRLPEPNAQTMPWLTGACLLTSRAVWERLGGFDEEFFLYWEDIELSKRALDRGIRLDLVTDAEAVHDAGGTQQHSAGRAKSATYYYYNARNRIFFGALYLDEAGFRRWRRADLRMTWEILMRGGKRQLVVRPSVLWETFRGLRDGRRISRLMRKRIEG